MIVHYAYPPHIHGSRHYEHQNVKLYPSDLGA